MKAWLASLLLIAICAAMPAFAQDSVPPADKPSQAQIEAAMDLLQANNSAANMKAVLETLLPIEAAQLRREHPTASDETIKTLVDALKGIVVAHTDDLMRLSAIAYARHFSVEEMHAMSSFYRSEPGQKYLTELPALMKETTPVVIGYMREIITREMEGVIEKMRAQGVKI